MVNNELVLLAFRARVLTLTGLPALKSTENVNFKPTINSPWLEENYVPATSQLLTAQARNGMVEETGLSIWKWYEPVNTGFLAVTRGIESMRALFTPGTNLSLSDGTSVSVRGDVGPMPSQILPDGKGWVYSVLTIPWCSYTTNVVAP